jgi:hypothetical protein
MRPRPWLDLQTVESQFSVNRGILANAASVELPFTVNLRALCLNGKAGYGHSKGNCREEPS